MLLFFFHQHPPPPSHQQNPAPEKWNFSSRTLCRATMGEEWMGERAWKVFPVFHCYATKGEGRSLNVILNLQDFLSPSRYFVMECGKRKATISQSRSFRTESKCFSYRVTGFLHPSSFSFALNASTHCTVVWRLRSFLPFSLPTIVSCLPDIRTWLQGSGEVAKLTSK